MEQEGTKKGHNKGHRKHSFSEDQELAPLQGQTKAGRDTLLTLEKWAHPTFFFSISSV